MPVCPSNSYWHHVVNEFTLMFLGYSWLTNIEDLERKLINSVWRQKQALKGMQGESPVVPRLKARWTDRPLNTTNSYFWVYGKCQSNMNAISRQSMPIILQNGTAGHFSVPWSIVNESTLDRDEVCQLFLTIASPRLNITTLVWLLTIFLLVTNQTLQWMCPLSW
jgi:hypothetical protein